MCVCLLAGKQENLRPPLVPLLIGEGCKPETQRQVTPKPIHQLFTSTPISTRFKSPIFHPKDSEKSCSNPNTNPIIPCDTSRGSVEEVTSPPLTTPHAQIKCHNPLPIFGEGLRIHWEELIIEKKAPPCPLPVEAESLTGPTVDRDEEEEEEDQSIFFTPELFGDEEDEDAEDKEDTEDCVVVIGEEKSPQRTEERPQHGIPDFSGAVAAVPATTTVGLSEEVFKPREHKESFRATAHGQQGGAVSTDKEHTRAGQEQREERQNVNSRKRTGGEKDTTGQIPEQNQQTQQQAVHRQPVQVQEQTQTEVQTQTQGRQAGSRSRRLSRSRQRGPPSSGKLTSYFLPISQAQASEATMDN